jgi:hypothetical protein
MKEISCVGEYSEQQDITCCPVPREALSSLTHLCSLDIQKGNLSLQFFDPLPVSRVLLRQERLLATGWTVLPGHQARGICYRRKHADQGRRCESGSSRRGRHLSLIMNSVPEG